MWILHGMIWADELPRQWSLVTLALQFVSSQMGFYVSYAKYCKSKTTFCNAFIGLHLTENMSL